MRFGLQELTSQDRLSHDNGVGIGEKKVIPPVATAVGLAYLEGSGQSPVRAVYPLFAGEVHTGVVKILPVERQDDVAFASPGLQALEKKDIRAAGGRGVADDATIR